MCDYSMHSVTSRSARAGDKLITISFATTYTRGFTAVGEPGVAVCILPGTELVFEKDIEWEQSLFAFFRKKRASGKLIRFRQINLERPDTHHDAIEFPNGHIVLLTNLRLGQKATVLQLPVDPRAARQERPAERQANGPIIDLVPTRTELSDRLEWFFPG